MSKHFANVDVRGDLRVRGRVQDNLRVAHDVEASHFYARGIGEVKAPDVTDGGDTFLNQTTISVNPADFYLTTSSEGGVVINIEGDVGGGSSGNFCFTHTQGAAATEWQANHGLGSPDLVVQVYDEHDRLIQPDEVDTTSTSVAFFYFANAQDGKAVILSCGGAAGGGVGVSDHGGLTGLADDDHAQYSLVDGTRAYTGTLQGNLGVDQAVKAEAFYIESGGNFGASGTAGDIRMEGRQLIIPDGTADDPSFRHETMDPGDGLFWTGSSWRFRIGNSNQLTLQDGAVSVIDVLNLSDGLETDPALRFTSERMGMYKAGTSLIGVAVDDKRQVTVGKDGINVRARSKAGGFYLNEGALGIGRSLNEDIISFDIANADVENYWLENFVDQGFIVDDVHIIVDGGSCTAGFYIHVDGETRPGVSITGLDPISVSSTKTVATATGANVVNPGDSLVLSVPTNASASHVRGRVKIKLSG